MAISNYYEQNSTNIIRFKQLEVLYKGFYWSFLLSYINLLLCLTNTVILLNTHSVVADIMLNSGIAYRTNKLTKLLRLYG